MLPFEILHTDRLHLRKITQKIYDVLFQEHLAAEQMKVLGLESEEALEQERTKYEKGLSTFNKTFLFFQLIDPKEEIIFGWCGFHTWYTDHGRAEIGYGITKSEYLNQGFMSEAIHTVLQYGFEKMQLNRVEAFIAPNNIPSIKLVEKMGFTKEGQLRAHYLYKGRLEDSLVYSLLKEEFGL